MPIYEYGCQSCSYVFEGTYRIDDRKIPEDEPCPQCNKKQVTLLMSAVGCAFDTQLKPAGDFRERMQEIKKNFRYDPYAKIKDY